MENFRLSVLLSFIRHLVPVTLIFFVTALIRYPVFSNSDHFFTSDEGLMANTIWTLLNGGPLVFYYDFVRYFGLTFGLVSAPFMWILGGKTLAFNLPGVLFYSLYVWTTYLIARIIVPRMAFLVLVLMLVTPSFITQMTTHNWPHVPSAFFGNLIFLLFIKAKMSDKNRGGVIFFLFFSMGLAIYTYTFSLIFISVVAGLYALSHPEWEDIRGKISFAALAGLFKDRETKMEVLVRFLDVLIVLFFMAIVFSYVFGGFGIDIGGVTVFQVNNFHKPVIQLLGILLLRTVVYRADLVSFLQGAKFFVVEKISPDTRNRACLGGAGFLLGLSPRIASILVGETSRGGQGFDTDLLPTKLISHFWEIVAQTGPRLFGLERPLQYFTFDSVGGYGIILGILPVLLSVLLILAAASFYATNLISVKRILTFRSVEFDAVHIFILLPVLTCLANVIVQNGSEPRYLFPLFGIFVLWIGIFLDKVQEKSKWLPALVLVVWGGFYSTVNYQAYKNQGLIDGFTPVKLERIAIYDVVEFLESKEIQVAYSDYGVSAIGTFLSEGKINISEYDDNPKATTQKARSAGRFPFAIIAQDNAATVYSEFLEESKIEFKLDEIGGYKIFWRFSGDDGAINKLRSLIVENQTA